MAINISAWSIRHPLPPDGDGAVIVALGYLSFNRLPITRCRMSTSRSFRSRSRNSAPRRPNWNRRSPRPSRTPSPASPASTTSPRRSRDGISNTTIPFRLETNTDRALNDVKDAVTRVRAYLPRGIDEPLVQRVDIAGLPILTYAAIAPGKTPEQLSWFVEDVVVRALQGVRGVGRVDRIGAVEREIRVGLDPIRLQAVGLTAARCQPAACAAAMSISPAAAPRSAAATRRSARSPAPRPWPISRRRGSPCRPAARCGSTISASSPTRSPNRAPSRGSTARRWSASASCAPRAQATSPSRKRWRQDRQTIKTANPDVDLKLIDTLGPATRSETTTRRCTRCTRARRSPCIVVFLFLRDLRATIIAAITLAAVDPSGLLGHGGARLLAQHGEPAGDHALDRHSGRRRDRRDRKHRAPYPAWANRPTRRRSRRPTKSGLPSSRSA